MQDKVQADGHIGGPMKTAFPGGIWILQLEKTKSLHMIKQKS